MCFLLPLYSLRGGRSKLLKIRVDVYVHKVLVYVMLSSGIVLCLLACQYAENVKCVLS